VAIKLSSLPQSNIDAYLAMLHGVVQPAARELAGVASAVPYQAPKGVLGRNIRLVVYAFAHALVGLWAW
jgi:hypothetical protein